jgi:uncharacterized membrane protein YjgN (DUF898 family)
MNPERPETAAPSSAPGDAERPAAPVAPRLALQLEDSPLRRELVGSGAAYFRIWVVNLLLTLLTLGVYSAWAKVRKARWFAQHTELDGDRFDFHGEPRRILVGRVVALLLLAVWSWSFAIAPWVGLAVLGLFCVLGPLLFASAERFRLANTSWRGMRFGFAVPRARLYAVCVPLLLLWTAGSVAQAQGIEGGWLVAIGLLPLLGLPWAHARLKHLQHSHASFGDRRFEYQRSAPEFYGVYATAVALFIVALVIGVLLGAAWAAVQASGPAQGGVSPAPDSSLRPQLAGLLAGAGLVLLIWLMVWPWFAARLQQVVWGHTRYGDIGFRGEMEGHVLWLLLLRHMAGVLLSCGLWWPFAAVAVARYRSWTCAWSAALQRLSCTSGAGPRGPSGCPWQRGPWGPRRPAHLVPSGCPKAARCGSTTPPSRRRCARRRGVQAGSSAPLATRVQWRRRCCRWCRPGWTRRSATRPGR